MKLQLKFEYREGLRDGADETQEFDINTDETPIEIMFHYMGVPHHITILDKEQDSEQIYVKMKKSSWEWLLNCLYSGVVSGKRQDGQSLGNFWALVQRIEEQYNERGGEKTW